MFLTDLEPVTNLIPRVYITIKSTTA